MPAESPAEPGGFKAHASPSVRKFARELGVDLQQVVGSGPKGRITPDDVREHVKAVMASGARPAAGGPGAATGAGLGIELPPWPVVDFAKFGPVERVAMSRIRRISGPSLTRNAILIPHVILAAAVLPLAIVTLSRGLRRDDRRHRRIARWTLPIWLFVSVTGVLVYLMLY